MIFAGDSDADLDEIEEFLTGTRHAAVTDRVLATVLFTDIVGSTEHLAELGDRKWRDLLDAHDRTIRRQLERFRGREVDTTGDGFVATFDGPGRAIECGCAMRDAVQALGLEIRVGLHTGEIEVRGRRRRGRGRPHRSPRRATRWRGGGTRVLHSQRPRRRVWHRVRRSRRTRTQGRARDVETVLSRELTNGTCRCAAP